MLPCSFYFLRHGETDWNREGRIQGHTDIPLNAAGRAQAARAVSVLSRLPIDRLVTSTLARARETAALVNADLARPLSEDEDLRERNFGSFEGLLAAEMERQKQNMLENGLLPEENGYPCPPGGERYAAFRERILAAFARHLERFPGENLLFVAHGGVYRVLRRCLFAEVDSSANVEPFHFERRGAAWVLTRLA